MQRTVRCWLGLLLVAGGNAHAGDGMLASDWGESLDGHLRVPFDLASKRNDWLVDVVALPGGGSVAVGTVECVSPARCVGIARLDAAGTVTKKTAFAPFFPGVKQIAVWSAALDANGGLLVAGTFQSQQSLWGDFTARFDDAGQPLNFSGANTNLVFSNFPLQPDSQTRGVKVLALPGGGFFLAGQSGAAAGIMKFKANGTPDATFYGSGQRVYRDPSQAGIDVRNAALSGKMLVLVGQEVSEGDTAAKDGYVQAFDSGTGKVHPQFGTAGLLRLPFNLGPVGHRDDSADAVVVDADGSVVIIRNAQVSASRNRTLLTKLGKDGTAVFTKHLTIDDTESSFFRDIVARPTGGYLIGGNLASAGQTQITVAAFTGNGTTDFGFGTSGKTALTFSTSGDDEQTALALDAARHVLVGGQGRMLGGDGLDYLLGALGTGK